MNYEALLEELNEREDKMIKSVHAWNDLLVNEDIYITQEHEDYITNRLIEISAKLREVTYIKERIKAYVRDTKD